MPYENAHRNPAGPGDDRPTASAVVHDEGLVGKLVGKTVLITGGTSGIGIETARALCTGLCDSKGYRQGESMVKAIGTAEGLPVQVIQMELDSLASIKAGATDFLRRSKGLNILICNAGVMACPEAHTKDGFEYQFGVDYLGHFVLFELLKDTLVSSSSSELASRVVTLSSSAHRGGRVRVDDYNFEKEPYHPWAAYGQAKTAQLYLANEIERRFGRNGVHGLSVHPGIIHTPLERHVGDDPMAQEFLGDKRAAGLWKSPAQGAATSVWAAIGKEWEAKGGRYLENMHEATPFDAHAAWHPLYAEGYADFAYGKKAASRLWEDSLVMIRSKAI